MSCLRAGQARAQDSCRIGFPKTCTEVLTPRPLFYGRALTENDKPMIRPFQPFDTISTRRSAPDATGYIIRESLRTVPSSAVRLTADLGLYRCFMDAGGGKTGHGRLFVRRIGRTLEPNVPGRIRPAGIPRRTGSACRYRNSCPARFAPARGTLFGYRIPDTQVGILFAVRCTLYPESRGCTGADAATGTLARRRLVPARGTVFGYRIPCTQVGIVFAVRHTLFPEFRNPAAARERMPLPELLPGEFRSGPGTVFGYRYEKRCLFRFIRNISFPGSLRAAREWMPLLKLLPGGVSPRPGTSGFFIPSPACRFSPARC